MTVTVVTKSSVLVEKLTRRFTTTKVKTLTAKGPAKSVTVRPVRALTLTKTARPTVIISHAGVPGPSGGGSGSTGSRQHGYATSAGLSFSYCGTAAAGALPGQAVWTIVRLSFSSGGSLVQTATSVTSPNSVWDDYLTESYA